MYTSWGGFQRHVRSWNVIFHLIYGAPVGFKTMMEISARRGGGCDCHRMSVVAEVGQMMVGVADIGDGVGVYDAERLNFGNIQFSRFLYES